MKKRPGEGSVNNRHETRANQIGTRHQVQHLMTTRSDDKDELKLLESSAAIENEPVIVE